MVWDYKSKRIIYSASIASLGISGVKNLWYKPWSKTGVQHVADMLWNETGESRTTFHQDKPIPLEKSQTTDNEPTTKDMNILDMDDLWMICASSIHLNEAL